jgi:hypothetical protein
MELASSLAPSNLIATEINGGEDVFPNLARETKVYSNDEHKYVLVPNYKDIREEIDRQVYAELAAAGIPKMDGYAGSLGAADMSFGDKIEVKGEVPTGIVGFAYRWKFERAWYYYRAEGEGIPPEFAIPFDKQWGRECRVHGDCACRGAEYWGEGFAIGSYHIDTPRALKAFVEMLKGIHKPRLR